MFKRVEPGLIALAFTCLAVLSFMTFAGAKTHYFFPIDLIFGKAAFANDIYVQSTYIFKTTLFFSLIKALGLYLNNDSVAIAWHMGLSALGTVYLWRTLRLALPEAERLTIWVLTLLLAQGSFKLLEAVYASPISLHNTNPSELANTLSFVALYHLVAGRAWAASAFMALMLLFAARGEFLLVAIAGLLFVKDWPRLASLILPLAAVVYLARLADYPKDPASIAAITANVFEREGSQVALHLHGWFPNLLLASSLVLQPLLLRRLSDSPWRRVGVAVAVVSILAYLFGLAYTWIGYRWLSSPPLILLSFPRAMKFHTIFFLGTAYILLLRGRETTSWRVALLLTALLLLKPYPGPAAAAAVLAALAFVPVPRRLAALPFPPAMGALALCLAVLAVQVPRSLPMSSASFSGFGRIERWTRYGQMAPEEWAGYRQLAEDGGDYPIIALTTRAGGVGFAPDDVYTMAHKSRLISEAAHLYFRPDLWPESETRLDVVGRAMAALNAGHRLDPQLAVFLAERQAALVLPATLAPLAGPVAKTLGPLALVKFAP